LTTTLGSIRAALLGKIRTLGGTGYTHNLTATDAVKAGRYPTRWGSSSCACIFLVGDETEQATTLAGRDHVTRFGMAWWVMTTAADPETRTQAAEAAYADLLTRFRASADRSLGGLSTDVTPALEDFFGGEAAEPADCTLAVFSITVRWREMP